MDMVGNKMDMVGNLVYHFVDYVYVSLIYITGFLEYHYVSPSGWLAAGFEHASSG